MLSRESSSEMGSAREGTPPWRRGKRGKLVVILALLAVMTFEVVMAADDQLHFQSLPLPTVEEAGGEKIYNWIHQIMDIDM